MPVDSAAITGFPKPQNAIATADCRPTMTPDGELWEYPCGLACTPEVMARIPGMFYHAIQEAHERHHQVCGHVESWRLFETVETGDSWVKVTFDCRYGGQH